jgi:two-component system NtrC family sensor kinase
MGNKPDTDSPAGDDVLTSGITRRLLEAKAPGGFRSPHAWIIAGIFIAFAYIYYGVLKSYHDIYAIIFFYPMISAAIVYRLKGVLISGIAFLGVIIPQALLFGHDLVSLMRTLIFALFAFLISGLGATLLNYIEHQVEAYKEIVSLNEELNQYIERLQKTQQQLIQAAKLGSIGELSAGVAHELNNPLAGVLVYTRLIKDKLARDSFNKEQLMGSLDKVESAIEYCTGIIRGLLDFARQSPPLLRPVTVSRAVDKAMSLVGHQAKIKRIEVISEENPALPLVVADFNQLVQVIINLLVNGIDAMQEGCKMTIRTSGDNGWVRISVSDTGCGITTENMEKLFTPFFTTKEDVKGVGLGLAVSYGIIERHGGRIEVQSEVGRGSTFTIVLPAYRGEEPPKPTENLAKTSH